jgi:hypothetical protein
MAAIEWLRRVANAMEMERRKERERGDATRTWRDQRAAAARAEAPKR